MHAAAWHLLQPQAGVRFLQPCVQRNACHCSVIHGVLQPLTAYCSRTYDRPAACSKCLSACRQPALTDITSSSGNVSHAGTDAAAVIAQALSQPLHGLAPHDRSSLRIHQVRSTGTLLSWHASLGALPHCLACTMVTGRECIMQHLSKVCFGHTLIPY